MLGRRHVARARSAPRRASRARAEARAPSRPSRSRSRRAPIAAFDPRAPDQVRFGALEFRGGLALTSSHRDFGGVSAIRVGADGAQLRRAHRQGRTGSPAASSMTRSAGRAASRTPRWRRCSGPTAARWRRAAGTTPSRSPRTAARSMSASSASTASCASTSAASACWRAPSRSRLPPGIAKLPNNKGLGGAGIRAARACRSPAR